jgi:hypothetical protein
MKPENSNLRYDKEIEERLGIELHRPQCEAGSGVDFSAMCIVTAKRNYLYCLKEFHTLVPENEIQL